MTVKLTIGKQHFSLEVADTRAKQQKGLGGRDAMPQDIGMLFIFNETALRRVWMKDTHFALDIIWLDGDRRIQHIEANVSPDTYPKIFDPECLSQYVIELNAGQAARVGLRIGQKLTF
jgi:uncharacterized membrane protein (UPF0127 family)